MGGEILRNPLLMVHISFTNPILSKKCIGSILPYVSRHIINCPVSGVRRPFGCSTILPQPFSCLQFGIIARGSIKKEYSSKIWKT